jgi:hypothetical protein
MYADVQGVYWMYLMCVYGVQVHGPCHGPHGPQLELLSDLLQQDSMPCGLGHWRRRTCSWPCCRWLRLAPGLGWLAKCVLSVKNKEMYLGTSVWNANYSRSCRKTWLMRIISIIFSVTHAHIMCIKHGSICQQHRSMASHWLDSTSYKIKPVVTPDGVMNNVTMVGMSITALPGVGPMSIHKQMTGMVSYVAKAALDRSKNTYLPTTSQLPPRTRSMRRRLPEGRDLSRVSPNSIYN